MSRLASGPTTIEWPRYCRKMKLARSIETPPSQSVQLFCQRLVSASGYALRGDHLARAWIEKHQVARRAVEVKHVVQRSREFVEGTVADLRQIPVFFDKANHRTLIDKSAIDVVRAGVQRNHQERQAWPVAAACLNRFQRVSAVAAGAGSGQRVLNRIRGV